MNDNAQISRESALFLQLVLGLQQSAMIGLGKLTHPITQKVEIDLEMARGTIDTLEAIEQRTRGNLDPQEARALKQVLTDLRMNYVEEVKKAASPAQKSVGTSGS